MTTATVYRLSPSPFLDVAMRVIHEMDPGAVVIVDDAVTTRLRAAIRNPRADHEDTA